MSSAETKGGPKIEADGPGPIEGTFDIDLAPGFGAYEFRGRRGSGKTTLLQSIDWLAGHKVDVTLHDGKMSGKISGFGVVAPIGGRKRRSGDFELDTIDAEKFSISDIVDPPGKTAEVRDAHVIKALASLSEMEADPKLYYELAGGQEAFDQLGILPTDDPVLLATRVKKAYDTLSNVRSKTAEAEAGHAAPLEVVPDGLDMKQSSDLDALGEERDQVRDRHKTLTDDREAAIQKGKDAAEAEQKLEKVKAEYDGPSVKEATDDAEFRAEETAKAARDAEVLRVQLSKALQELDKAKADERLALQKVETAAQHETAVDTLQETANQEVSCPSPKEVTAAQVEVAKATEAYDQGIRIRDCKQNQAKATKHREAEKAAEKESADAKAKAGEVFDLLAKALHTEHLLIESVDGDPRLFVQHPKRGKTLFDRVNGLSDGERVDYTLRELLPHIEPPGMLPIPQRVYQDLQPSDRKNLHDLAVDKKLYLFGAQVDDGKLRVVWLGDEELTENPTQVTDSGIMSSRGDSVPYEEDPPGVDERNDDDVPFVVE